MHANLLESQAFLSFIPYILVEDKVGFLKASSFSKYRPTMVISSIFTGARQPVRSISLPTRVEPQKIDSLLKNLKSFQISSFNEKNACFGFETIQIALVGLAELYTSVGKLVQSSSIQQALLHYQQGKLVEEALNESDVLIESCSIARDVILMVKECIQTLQSALRRKGADSSIESHIRAYFTFRRKAKKDIGKCLGSLKRMENNKLANFPLLDLPNHDLVPIITRLREAKTISISIFGDLLGLLSAPVAKAKASGWSLISQLMPAISSTSDKGEKTINEMESVDVALYSLLSHIRRNSNDNKAELVQMAQRRLGKLAASFEGIEGQLDSMFRCLLKHRVCFLNMLTH